MNTISPVDFEPFTVEFSAPLDCANLFAGGGYATGAQVLDAEGRFSLVGVGSGEVLGCIQGLTPENAAEKIRQSFSAPREYTDAEYSEAVQAWLDAQARSLGYDSIFTAATYKDSPVAKFAAEAETLTTQRDCAWAECYRLLATGELPSTTTPQALVERLFGV